MRKRRPVACALAALLMCATSACALPSERMPEIQKSAEPMACAPAASGRSNSRLPADVRGEWLRNEVTPVDAEKKIWNVKDFGAVGDGQADDTSALQAGIQTLMEAGGGTLYFPNGTYLLSKTLRLDMDGETPLIFQSDPAGSVMLTAADGLEGPVVYVDQPYVTFDGVSVTQWAGSTEPGLVLASDHALLYSMSVYMTGKNTQPGIVVYGSQNTIKQSGVGYVDSTEHMIVFSKRPGQACEGNVLEDCHFGGQHGKCVLVTSEDEQDAPRDLHIRRNVFLVVACDQVEVRAGRNIYITENMLDAAGVCVLMDPLPVGIDGLQMTNNYCGASTGGDRTGGLRTENTYDGYIHRAVVSANYFWCPRGILLTSEKYTDFRITDNYFVLMGEHALYMKSAAGSYLEGNVVTNVSATVALCIETVDDRTVIQYNAWTGTPLVPEWNTRFASMN